MSERNQTGLFFALKSINNELQDHILKILNRINDSDYLYLIINDDQIKADCCQGTIMVVNRQWIQEQSFTLTHFSENLMMMKQLDDLIDTSGKTITLSMDQMGEIIAHAAQKGWINISLTNKLARRPTPTGFFNMLEMIYYNQNLIQKMWLKPSFTGDIRCRIAYDDPKSETFIDQFYAQALRIKDKAEKKRRLDFLETHCKRTDEGEEFLCRIDVDPISDLMFEHNRYCQLYFILEFSNVLDHLRDIAKEGHVEQEAYYYHDFPTIVYQTGKNPAYHFERESGVYPTFCFSAQFNNKEKKEWEGIKLSKVFKPITSQLPEMESEAQTFKWHWTAQDKGETTYLKLEFTFKGSD